MISINIIIHNDSPDGNKPSSVLGGEIKLAENGEDIGTDDEVKLAEGGEIIGANLLPYGSQSRIATYGANGQIDLENGVVDFTVDYDRGLGEFVAPKNHDGVRIPMTIQHTTLHSYKDDNGNLVMLSLPLHYKGSMRLSEPHCYSGIVELSGPLQGPPRTATISLSLI